MGWFNKKNGDYFIKIIDMVAETSTAITEIKVNTNNLSKHMDAHVADGKEWQKEINKKIGLCPEHNRIDSIASSLSTKLNEDTGKIKAWRLIAAVTATIATI